MRDIKEQCTTLEQSRKLKELGFTEDSASLVWEDFSIIGQSEEIWAICFANGNQEDIYNPIPCWTNTDMIELIYQFIESSLEKLKVNLYPITETIDVQCGETNIKQFDKGSLRDNLFDFLVWIKETNTYNYGK